MHGMGWHRDLPDIRDYTPEKMGAVLKAGTLPSSVDLQQWCSPVEDQGSLGSCTAQAGVGLLEYFHRRTHGTHTNLSRLFTYKVTRNLLGWTGDQGAFLRTTMAALRLFGTPPERFYPYHASKFDDEPTAYLYAMAKEYQAVNYVRLDAGGRDGLVDRIREFTAAGFASMFGFTVYHGAITRAAGTGFIAMPAAGDTVDGGHAVMIVGYDDSRQAFKIRNSWGYGWGAGGYGWIPYEYFETGLATDVWTLMSAEWVDTKQFGLG